MNPEDDAAAAAEADMARQQLEASVQAALDDIEKLHTETMKGN